MEQITERDAPRLVMIVDRFETMDPLSLSTVPANHIPSFTPSNEFIIQVLIPHQRCPSLLFDDLKPLFCMAQVSRHDDFNDSSSFVEERMDVQFTR
jgi:hypothetical protein